MKSLVIFLLACCLEAAIPPMEGLFRNAGVEPIAGNLVVVDLMVTEQPKIQDIDAKAKENFVKLIFYLREDKSLSLFQLQYADSVMNDRGLLRFNKVLNLHSRIKSDLNLERATFFSLLRMLGLNSSSSICYIMKKYNKDFKYNREILNMEKIALFREYKKYLLAADRDKMTSPLNPIKTEERMRIDNILKSSMFKDSGNVKQIRKEGDFFWKISLEKAEVLFSNEEHYLKELRIRLPKGQIEYNLDEYVDLSGTHPFPSQLVIKDYSEAVYKVKVLNFKVSQITSGKILEKFGSVQLGGNNPTGNIFPGTFLF